MKYIPNISVPTIKISGYMSQDVDKFSRDEEAKAQRQEILDRQKKNTFFYTIRETLKSIAGPLTGAGLGLFVAGTIDGSEEIADALRAPQDSGAELIEAKDAAKVSEEASISPKTKAGLAMLGGSAVATTGALMANAAGAKYAHAASFDQSELNAQHNAKYIRQELEEMRAEQAQPVVVFNNPDAERSDGKSWTQAEDERAADRLNQQHQV